MNKSGKLGKGKKSGTDFVLSEAVAKILPNNYFNTKYLQSNREKIMKLLFYYSRESVQTKSLEVLIQSFVPEDSLEVYTSLESVTERLREPTDNITTAVFVATSMAELKSFYKLRNCFFDLRHIIILPEKDEKMIASAHKLRPRFLSYFEHDFNVVAAVLKKMFSDKRNGRAQYQDAMNLESAGIANSGQDF